MDYSGRSGQSGQSGVSLAFLLKLDTQHYQLKYYQKETKNLGLANNTWIRGTTTMTKVLVLKDGMYCTGLLQTPGE